jgi:hypothetical protein
MSAVHPPTWPNGRAVAGWWPQLDRFFSHPVPAASPPPQGPAEDSWALIRGGPSGGYPLRPRSLWLYHLLLHHVEALVGVFCPEPEQRLSRLLLEALVSPAFALRCQPATTALARHLHMDPQFLHRLLSDLANAGLARARGEGVWELTEAGQKALARDDAGLSLRERRGFFFSEGPETHPGPRFLPLEDPATWPLPEPEDWQFDVGLLRDCVRQPTEWKQRQGFPLGVEEVVTGAGADQPGTEPWRQVVVDRPEQTFVLFALAGEGADERLVGLTVVPGSWQLQLERPVLSLGPGWREALPELAADTTQEDWRRAWRDWGQSRNLPPADLEACHLEDRGLALRVRAPQPLAERLLSSRNEFVRGETWLVAGEDQVRRLTLIDLAES